MEIFVSIGFTQRESMQTLGYTGVSVLFTLAVMLNNGEGVL